jgi:hypothetical protein
MMIQLMIDGLIFPSNLGVLENPSSIQELGEEY